MKRYYSDYLWIIIIRNNNKIVHHETQYELWLQNSQENIKKKAIEKFLIDPNDYLVMEMEQN